MERRCFVKTLVIGTGTMMFLDLDANASGVNEGSILVKMIYNNTGTHNNYKKEWGLSLWIEKNNQAVLFDTGGNAEIFWKNLQAAGTDLSKLSVIVISHNHWII